jgi:hypothetical protein
MIYIYILALSIAKHYSDEFIGLAINTYIITRNLII